MKKLLVLITVASLFVNVPKSIAGVTISSIRAVASTNAFAPLNKSAYYDEHVLLDAPNSNISASGDWTGTNFGGTTPTWHWIGSAKTEMAAIVNPLGMIISGKGSFSSFLETTPAYVNPNTQTLQYQPGSDSNFEIVFSVSELSHYTLSCVQTGSTLVQLGSIDTGAYFVDSRGFPSSGPFTLDSSGWLSPGRYGIRSAAGAGLATNNTGATQTYMAGSVNNLLISISVPEPALLGALGFAGLFLRRGRLSV